MKSRYVDKEPANLITNTVAKDSDKSDSVSRHEKVRPNPTMPLCRHVTPQAEKYAASLPLHLQLFSIQPSLLSSASTLRPQTLEKGHSLLCRRHNNHLLCNTGTDLLFERICNPLIYAYNILQLLTVTCKLLLACQAL